MHKLTQNEYELAQKYYNNLYTLIQSRQQNEKGLSLSIQKTTYAFKDSHGHDLLSYAVILSEDSSVKHIDEVIGYMQEEFHKNLITEKEVSSIVNHALEKALEHDDLDLVEKILAFNFKTAQNMLIKADLGKIKFSICGEGCREYIREKIRKNLLMLTTQAYPLKKEDEEEALMQAAAIGELSFIESSKVFLQNGNIIENVLEIAVEHDSLDVLKGFFKPELIESKIEALLLKAIQSHADKVLNFFLTEPFPLWIKKQIEIDINIVISTAIKVALCAAYTPKSSKHIEKLLAIESLNPISSYIYTLLLMYADLCENNEIKQHLALMEYEKISEVSENEEFRKQIKKAILSSTQVDPSTDVVVQDRLDQSLVLKKLHFYSKLNYSSPDYLNDGQCSGFNFLYVLYTVMGRREHFFRAMSKMAKWDGSEASLMQDFDVPIINNKKVTIYKNLNELFEQWINDVVWFQHSSDIMGKNGKHISELLQRDRQEQLELIGDVTVDQGENKLPKVVKVFDTINTEKGNEEPMTEAILDVIKSMPINIILELWLQNHVVAIVRSQHGLSFYDSNAPYMTSEMLSIDQIANFTRDAVSRYKNNNRDYSVSMYYLMIDNKMIDFKTLIEGMKEELPKIITEEHNLCDLLNNIHDTEAQKTVIVAMHKKLIENVGSLCIVLKNRDSEAQKTLIDAIQDELPKIIGNASSLYSVLARLNSEVHKTLIDAMHEKLPKIIEDAACLQFVLEALNPKEHKAVIVAIQKTLPEIIKNTVIFEFLIDRIDLEARRVVIDAMQEKLPRIVENVSNFCSVVKKLDSELRKTAIVAMHNKLPEIIVDRYTLNNALENLDAEECKIVIVAMYQKLPEIIVDRYTLNNVLKKLNADGCKVMINAMQGKLSTIIKEGFGNRGTNLCDLLKMIGDAAICKAVLDAMDDELSTIIDDQNVLFFVISYPDNEIRNAVISAMQKALPKIIRNTLVLESVLNKVNLDTYKIVIDVMKTCFSSMGSVEIFKNIMLDQPDSSKKMIVYDAIKAVWPESITENDNPYVESKSASFFNHNDKSSTGKVTSEVTRMSPT